MEFIENLKEVIRKVKSWDLETLEAWKVVTIVSIIVVLFGGWWYLKVKILSGALILLLMMFLVVLLILERQKAPVLPRTPLKDRYEPKNYGFGEFPDAEHINRELMKI